MAAWVSTLRHLASTCDYGDRTEEFIRDQVVERTASNKLRQRLLMEGSGLTLTATLTVAETIEGAEREAKAMEGFAAGAEGPVPVQAVQHSKSGKRVHAVPKPRLSNQCWDCGRQGHSVGDMDCPARGIECRRCGGPNHFARHCRGSTGDPGSKAVSTVTVMALGAEPLTVCGAVDGQDVEFVVDTGSPVSILPHHMVSK